MERIGILQLGYETNSFSPGLSHLGDLGTGDWLPAEAVIPQLGPGRSSVSGAIKTLQDMGAQPVPLDMMTRAGAFNAGPILASGVIQQAMDHVCAQIKTVLPLDGLFFAMHGATCAQDEEDADSYFLRRLRQVLPEVPIVCSMDLHGNITPEMTRLATAIFGIKELPHVDFYETGCKAAAVLVELLRGRCRPQMALVNLPMLLNPAAGNSISGPGAMVRDTFRDYAQTHGLLDASFFHGFSGTDSSVTGCSVLAVADGFEPRPQAEELAELVWAHRAEFDHPVYKPEAAIEAALAGRKGGYALINDGCDNPGGGCPGDGTHLLRVLLEQDVPGAIMGPLFDPIAAAICHSHSVGEQFSLTFGGRNHPAYGLPITAEVTLLALCDGTFTCATPMYRGVTMCYGPSARLRIGQVECILVSRRFQTYDDRPFLMLGADLKNYRLVALKSMNHFRAWFTDLADCMITADTPSLYPIALSEIPYRHIPRPIYPLDSITSRKKETK